MGDKYPTHDAPGPTNWSVAMWDNTDDNDKDEAKPGAGDKALFSSRSGNIIANENTPALGDLDMSQKGGFTNTLTINTGVTIDVDGAGVILTGTIAGDGSIEASGTVVWTTDLSSLTLLTLDGGAGWETWMLGGQGALPAVTVNNNPGSLTAVSALNLGANTFTMTAGKFTAGTQDVICGLTDVNGGTLNTGSGDWGCTAFDMAGGTLEGTGDVTSSTDILITGGTFSHEGAWTQTGTGDISMPGGLGFTDLVVDGTADLIAIVRTKKISGTGDITKSGAGELYVRAGDPGWWNFTGTINASVRAYYTSNPPGADITIASGNFVLDTGNTYGVTMDGHLTLANGDVEVACAGAGTCTLDLAGKNVSCTDVHIGSSWSAIREGALLCGEGTITCRNILKGAAAGGDLNFEGITIRASGTIDGTGLTCTAGAAARVITGTVQDITLAAGGRLLKWGCLGVGNTVNVEDQARQLGMMPLAA